jgi:hypothetical protein
VKRADPPFWAVAVLVLVVAFVVMALTGCSQLKLEGGCEYERTITTKFTCPADGKAEQHRLAPWNPDL